MPKSELAASSQTVNALNDEIFYLRSGCLQGKHCVTLQGVISGSGHLPKAHLAALEAESDVVEANMSFNAMRPKCA